MNGFQIASTPMNRIGQGRAPSPAFISPSAAMPGGLSMMELGSQARWNNTYNYLELHFNCSHNLNGISLSDVITRPGRLSILSRVTSDLQTGLIQRI